MSLALPGAEEPQQQTDLPSPVAHTAQKGLPGRRTQLMITWGGLLSLVLVVVIIALAVSRQMTAIEQAIRNSGLLGLGLAFVVYVALGVSPIPTDAITILLTTTYGPLAGTGVAALGNTAAAIVEWFLGGKLGQVTHFDDHREELPWGLGKLPANSPLMLIGARMIPAYGSKFVSLASGVYHVSFRRYLWTTLVSMTLGAAMVSVGGFGVVQGLRQLLHIP
jgi:uncharacterized membrane protein YdjX (TVP38/TMEM64 family)